MPDLSPENVTTLREIAESYLAKNFEGWVLASDYGVGGSAAVFKATKEGESRAIKVSSPKFFEGNTASQLKRIELQKRIVNHQCESLVKIFALELYGGTCICIMEHLPWIELKDAIGRVPSENIQPIVDQLVEAVVCLKKIDLIHRDIKPENILIASDMKTIKLVDLGVVREISEKEDRLDSTDQGSHRPFLATAQYSSPEYLFRTAEPSKKLWEGLNLYQIGAVIYDLIQEEEIFAEEMRSENRYSLALAVLSKRPAILPEKRKRNNRLAGISESCLIKNLSTRIQIVKLSDFAEPKVPKASEQLRGALSLLSHKGEFETQAILQQQETSKRIEKVLNDLSDAVFNKLNVDFGSNLQINRIAARSTKNSFVMFASILHSPVRIQFTISAVPTTEFDHTSEVQITLENDKDTNSISAQGTFTLSGEILYDSIVSNLFEAISAELVKSLN